MHFDDQVYTWKQTQLSLIPHPFRARIGCSNCWVKIAAVVLWDDMAKVFLDRMSADNGRASINLRVVLDALLVKYVEDISDEDTIQYIQENIYVHSIVCLPSFQTRAVFISMLFVEIRNRLDK